MVDAVNFFAYGELINLDYFKEKGLEYVSKSSVTLSAWRRVFNKIPIDNGGLEKLGLVNIEPTPDNSGMMHGELYVMDEKFLPKLDELFGHPDEYQRKVMRFNRHDFILVRSEEHTSELQSQAYLVCRLLLEKKKQKKKKKT